MPQQQMPPWAGAPPPVSPGAHHPYGHAPSHLPSVWAPGVAAAYGENMVAVVLPPTVQPSQRTTVRLPDGTDLTFMAPANAVPGARIYLEMQDTSIDEEQYSHDDEHS